MAELKLYGQKKYKIDYYFKYELPTIDKRHRDYNTSQRPDLSINQQIESQITENIELDYDNYIKSLYISDLEKYFFILIKQREFKASLQSLDKLKPKSYMLTKIQINGVVVWEL